MKKLLPSQWTSRLLATTSVDIRYALLEACLIGLFSAFAALLLKEGIGWLGGWRIRVAYLYGSHVALPIVGLALGFLAGWLIELLAPAAAGGGIPQVKAVLARYPIMLNLRVAIVKTLGTILILGAGLTLGRRGPTVHIGAALAAQLSRWLPNSPTNRRQMIAAGAAAGLAAGFNTPIAGVLFVIEELMRDISGLTLEIAIIASFTGAVVSRLFDSADLNLPEILATDSHNTNFTLLEIAFCVLLGICAGLLGGLFNRSIIAAVSWSRRVPLAMPWRIGMAGLLSGTIIAYLPDFFRDNTGLREFLVAGELDWQTTAIAFVAHFCLTILAYGAGAPGGLFAPALVLGSALGYLVGTVELFLFGYEYSYLFALAGMGAFFTAVVRVPVTAIVIVFEITANFDVVLPLMISSAIAYIVAESFFPGSLYEHLLEVSGIELTEETVTHDFLSQLTANDVMQSRVESLPSNLTIDEVVKAMSRSHHRGFPVVEAGKLVGIVTQSDIASASQKQRQVQLRDIMTPQPITINPTASLTDVLYLLNRYQLSRLPVVESNKLIGIITRSDIIKAEAKRLTGDRETTVKREPSYVIYQTRSPATGRGRILLPISNPHHATSLMTLAVAIARYQKYEIQCLQVINVPKYIYPSQAKPDVTASRQLMHRLERWGRKQNIPLHTQVRIANDTAEAILETIAQEHINFLVMGWKGQTSSAERIFGNVVDTIIAQASCELMLVKLGTAPNSFPQNLAGKGKWLIPTAGGSNIQRAMKFLPALANLYTLPDYPQIELCQIYNASRHKFNSDQLKITANAIADKLNRPVFPFPIRGNSVPNAVFRLNYQQKYDLIIIGASSEGLLQNAVRGNIPEAIARKTDTTVIIVRRPL
ncbi:MAG TPA: chloride channel protein [Xenococcaceae cyanobacterium]